MTSDPSLPPTTDGLSVNGLRREVEARIEVEGRLRSELVAADERHRSELAEAEAAADDRAQRARADERECDMACMDKLVAAVRDLDDASTLSLVLDRLTAHASGVVTGRVMTFVVKEGVLRRWRTGRAGDPQECAEVPLTGQSVAAVAARSRTLATTRDRDDDARMVEALECAPLTDDRVGLVIPLIVGGETAAVIYADDVAESEPTVPSAWPEAVEVLARHAASCLERMTVLRAYGLHTAAPEAVQPSGSPTLGVARPSTLLGTTLSLAKGRDALSDSEDESAQRYARLLISEIKLYHEDEMMAGRRDANLLERLAPQISRARTLYEQRVPTEVRARNDYFGQELVRTLADGDRRLLGLDR